MRFKIKFSGSLIAFAVFLLLGGYRFMDLRVVFAYLMAATTHEMGHLIASRICRARVVGITFDVMGARIHLHNTLLSYRDEAVIAFFGPAVNFMSSVMFWETFPLFSELSLMLGIFNMMPVMSFDGQRILYTLTALCCGEHKAIKACRFCSFVFIVLMWTFATYILLRYRSGFSLFVLSCLLFSRFYI